MNSRVTLHCAWAALAVAAYFAGSLKDAPHHVAESARPMGSSNAPESASAVTERARETMTAGRRANSPREDLAGLPPDQMKARVFAALSEPVRWKRMLLVMELLAGMTA